ncbi:MAG TPA: HEAT repeat domain-containing protein [Pseudomonadales bacterium]|nr:HEAT repeat domain-containing protein [Pseudomonadales bacterium]
MTEREGIIQKIDSLKGREQENAPWLLSLLDHEDNMVRFCAIRPLIYACSVPNLPEKLRAMLDNESDDDVLLLVISGLASHYRGSKDLQILRRIQNAIERVGGASGTRDTFDDAKLEVMLGCDSKQLAKMSSAERQKQLAQINVTG